MKTEIAMMDTLKRINNELLQRRDRGLCADFNPHEVDFQILIDDASGFPFVRVTIPLRDGSEIVFDTREANPLIQQVVANVGGELLQDEAGQPFVLVTAH